MPLMVDRADPRLEVSAGSAGAPPPYQVAVSLLGHERPLCRPDQHVFLHAPTSWVCQCGETIILDSPMESSDGKGR